MKCPTCDSSHPHLHPAIQFEGEVETCIDDFHLRVTPENIEEYRSAVLVKRQSNLPSAIAWRKKAEEEST